MAAAGSGTPYFHTFCAPLWLLSNTLLGQVPAITFSPQGVMTQVMYTSQLGEKKEWDPSQQTGFSAEEVPQAREASRTLL